MKKRYLLLAAAGTSAALAMGCGKKKEPVIYANTKSPRYYDAGVPADGSGEPSGSGSGATGT